MAANPTAAESADTSDYSAYYEPVDRPDGADSAYEYFQPTGATVSVWSSDLQHGGPPMGLLTRSMERMVDPADGLAFSRVTMDILGAVGLDLNRVRVSVPRPGRQISQVAAELEARQPDGSYRLVARAVAWRLKVSDTSAVEHLPLDRLPTSPDELTSILGFPEVDGLAVQWGQFGFIGTVELAAQPGRNGHAQALWLRPTLPLVAGEETSNLVSACTVIDVANGIGTALRPTEWSWMNTDTTVHLVGQPRGRWIGVDSDTSVGTDGYGATFADLYDEFGFIGRSAQTVLLAGR